MQSYPDPQEKWVRVLPNLVDAGLVLSAIAMLAMYGWPGDWLSVKLALIVVYAMLALYVFRAARALASKTLVWLLALLVLLFIPAIAVLHHPLGILSVL